MWFEILPSGLIIMTLIATPQYFAWYWNSAIFGNPYRKSLHHIYDRHMFTRDTRIGGAPWLIKGIENIPDGK